MWGATVACTKHPAIAASTAFPPFFITSSIVSVTIGLSLLATAFLPLTADFGPTRGSDSIVDADLAAVVTSLIPAAVTAMALFRMNSLRFIVVLSLVGI
jgi:hypothetical protein